MDAYQLPFREHGRAPCHGKHSEMRTRKSAWAYRPLMVHLRLLLVLCLTLGKSRASKRHVASQAGEPGLHRHSLQGERRDRPLTVSTGVAPGLSLAPLCRGGGQEEPLPGNRVTRGRVPIPGSRRALPSSLTGVDATGKGATHLLTTQNETGLVSSASFPRSQKGERATGKGRDRGRGEGVRSFRSESQGIVGAQKRAHSARSLKVMRLENEGARLDGGLLGGEGTTASLGMQDAAGVGPREGQRRGQGAPSHCLTQSACLRNRQAGISPLQQAATWQGLNGLPGSTPQDSVMPPLLDGDSLSSPRPEWAEWDEGASAEEAGMGVNRKSGFPPMVYRGRFQSFSAGFEFYWWCNNSWRCYINPDNSLTLSTFWQDRMSGFYSLANIFYGAVTVQMRLPRVNSDGMYHTFYLIQPQNWPNNDSRHAEIDIEFYGAKDPRKTLIATNIIVGGYQRLEQHMLPFDPSAAYHEYTIWWGPEYIIFFVDRHPIRATKRPKGRPWPAKPLQLLGTTWATRPLIDYTVGPIAVNYRNIQYQACTTQGTDPPYPPCVKKASDPKYPWNRKLSKRQLQQLTAYRRKFLVNAWDWGKWNGYAKQLFKRFNNK